MADVIGERAPPMAVAHARERASASPVNGRPWHDQSYANAAQVREAIGSQLALSYERVTREPLPSAFLAALEKLDGTDSDR